VWALWALVRVIGIDRGFPLVALISFTPWMALGAVIPLGLSLALRRWAAAAVAAVVALVFAMLVLPRALGGPTEAEAGTGATLRVLASNVEFGQANAADLVALTRELDVDVLAVTELTPRFAEELRAAGIDELLPHAVLAAQPRARGTGLFAHTPLADRATTTLPEGFELASASVHTDGAAPVEVFAVHSVPPTSGGDAWREDLEALPDPSEETPRILLGDFNATVDHAEFRELLDRGYEDVAVTLGEGLTMTWPTDRRGPPLVAIDHVVADPRIGIREFTARDIPGADHRAVFAELDLPAG
jgi:endonuclease/exonuclease/phosphatase (EEP) superfamily protein YafD